MTFTAAMRLGSLEILAALAVFGYLGARIRSGTVAERPKALSLSLVVRDGAVRSAGREITLTVGDRTSVIIGRSREADLPLSDPEVSRRHARLDLVRGVAYVADQGSRNGTFLNGKALGDESIELRPGDDIDVGNTRITVRAMEPTQ
ncbi:MAG TPA: FHA domain-containing protein [Candidatus Baltobacteraceae bacterium]|nr:FHA domain-containing protein [Candidatus Baltobacteraceae bacterium]